MVIYRDLRPDNIFISNNGYIKLFDFTLSKKLNSDYTNSLCGTHEYHSPEMINQTGYNKSIDFWQLGILFYEMLFGYTPFIASDPIKIYEKIKKEQGISIDKAKFYVASLITVFDYLHKKKIGIWLYIEI